MPTLDQISDKIFRGQLVQASMAQAALTSERSGCVAKTWGDIVCISQLIEGLTTQVLGGDYTSDDTVAIYNNLSNKIGYQFIDGATLDPNAQQTPGVIFIGNQPQQQFNYDRIDFTNQTTVSLTPYQSVYYPRFGNAPQVQAYVANGLGGFNPDYGNVPTIDYVIPSDESSGISAITWIWPVGVTGYISIFGIQPST